MANQHKEEFPAIYPAGFYRHTIADVRKLCVDNFPGSSRRPRIMAGLEEMHQRLLAVGLDDSELWVNGSFATTKPEPDDVDFVLFSPSRFYDNGTEEQRRVLDWLIDNRDEIKQEFIAHTDAVLVYPPDSPLSPMTLAYQLEWADTFGHSVTTREPKGIVVVAIAQPQASDLRRRA